jgi:hypothetical protein
MDRAKVELFLFPAELRSNVETADRVRAAHVEHSIEDGHADSRFSLPTREAARP